MLRVHTSMGCIGVRFAVRDCECGAPLRADLLEAPGEPMALEAPDVGDLATCTNCQTFKVWRHRQWRRATLADLRQKLDPRMTDG